MSKAKEPFMDTPLHQRLRIGLLNAIEEKDWRVADLVRRADLSHATISDFLNAQQGIGLHSLQKCLAALRLTPADFFDRCDPTWQTPRLKRPQHAVTAPTPSPLPSRSQAALDQLKAAFDVAAALLSDEMPPHDPDETGTVPPAERLGQPTRDVRRRTRYKARP